MEISSYSTYKIKGSPKFTKRGLAQRASMVWTEDFKEIINIPNLPLLIDGCYSENGLLTVILNRKTDVVPTVDTFEIHFYADSQEVFPGITKIKVEGTTAFFYFNQITTVGTYRISISDGNQTRITYFQVV